MKLSIQTYFKQGDRVQRLNSKIKGTVITSGNVPKIEWDNGLVDAGRKIRLIRRKEKTLVDRIKHLFK